MKRLLPTAAVLAGALLVVLAVPYAGMLSWSRFSSPAAGIFRPPGVAGPGWEVVRFGAQHFAWPAFLVSRLGFNNTWVVLLIVGLLGLVAVRALRRERLGWLLALFAAYGAAGWVYFWVVPVPTPHIPHGKWIHDTEARELYFRAFTRGYQEGVTDSYINEDFVPEAYSRGKSDGLVAGIGERIRVAPRVMRSGLVEHLRKYPPTPEAEQ